MVTLGQIPYGCSNINFNEVTPAKNVALGILVILPRWICPPNLSKISALFYDQYIYLFLDCMNDEKEQKCKQLSVLRLLSLACRSVIYKTKYIIQYKHIGTDYGLRIWSNTIIDVHQWHRKHNFTQYGCLVCTSSRTWTKIFKSGLWLWMSQFCVSQIEMP